MDIPRQEEIHLGLEEDLKAWCRGSGENIGLMEEIWGSDEWNIRCPRCGMRWAGGSTVLPDHNLPGRR